MKKKIHKKNDYFLLQNELKLDKKNILQRKISTNSNFQKDSRIFTSKLINLDLNNPSIPHNIRSKNNLNLLPIKKMKSNKENEINTFSLFFNGENNNFSSKNEVNLITTQYNYGNNQLLLHRIHKTSKDFSSKKNKIHSFNNINNNINNNIIKDELEEKLMTYLNIGQKFNKKAKRAIILNNLKN